MFEYQFDNTPPEAGHYILSEPFLADPNFERSVVLLCEHDALTGTFGLMVNKLSEARLADIMEGIENDSHPVYIGGPVEQNTLHYLHRMGDVIEGSIHLGNGLYRGGDYHQLKNLINNNDLSPYDVRFFVGYAGWEVGQLQNELNENAWIVAPCHPDMLFETEAEQLWSEVLKQKGGKYKMYANYPADPRLN